MTNSALNDMRVTTNLLLAVGGVLVELAAADPLERVARQATSLEEEDDMFQGNSSELDNKPKGEVGPSLGLILGWLLLGCCILYVIGIGYKVMKIMKGTYVEEEPVFLKYK